MKKTAALLMMAMLCAMNAQAQGEVEMTYQARSTLKMSEGTACGRGDLTTVRARYTSLLAVSYDEQRRPTAWTATLRGVYAAMSNSDGAEQYNPDDIINVSLSVAHTRPLGRRWQLMASVGAGLYAVPDDVAWRSVLLSGGAVFAYRVSESLQIGLGGGVTTSYGLPMLLPMGYVNWTSQGKLRATIEMGNGLCAKLVTSLSKRCDLSLTPPCPQEVTVSRAKAADFLSWLNDDDNQWAP